MKAAVFTQYGSIDNIELQTIEKPIPTKNEVLVKVYATTVCTGDWRILGPNVPCGMGCLLRCMFGCCSPNMTTLGQEFAGVIEKIGADVTEFKVGDEVFGTVDINFNAHAEYLTIAEDFALIKKPSNMSMVEAATVPFGGLSSLYFLRDLINLSDGENVLINGASGCLGTFAIQLAKLLSPNCKVTAVCSGKNEELVRSLGADEFIDYTNTDVTKGSEKFDVIYDTVGKMGYYSACSIMSDGGIFATAAPSWGNVGSMLLNCCYCCGSKTCTTGAPDIGKGSKDDLECLKKWIEEGKLKTIIDTTFSLDDILDAFRLVASGHKKGSAAIIVNAEEAE